MHGARWGWVALIAAITVLFVASSQDQSSNNKMAALLRQELKTASAERDRVVTERNEAHETIETLSGWAVSVDQELTQTQQELRALKAERDKLRKELTSLSQDRNQLQQTVASLHLERSKTKRSVDQLRQGLQQLLTQSDAVALQLASPAPGFAQTTFEETTNVGVPTEARSQKPEARIKTNFASWLDGGKQEPVHIAPVKKITSSEGTYYADEPLNDNQ
ncbi:MAG: hypothetical protein QM703_24045 [Gemmatales bacterium]